VQYKVFTTMTLFGLLILPLAHAQSNLPVQANIPFDFGVRNRIMPAGDYKLTYTPRNGALFIRGSDGKNGVFVVTSPSTSGKPELNGKGKVVFNRVGGVYFLSQLWHGRGEREGLEVHKTSRERDLAAGMSGSSLELASVSVPTISVPR